MSHFGLPPVLRAPAFDVARRDQLIDEHRDGRLRSGETNRDIGARSPVVTQRYQNVAGSAQYPSLRAGGARNEKAVRVSNNAARLLSDEVDCHDRYIS